jgi:hypothetical protein
VRRLRRQAGTIASYGRTMPAGERPSSPEVWERLRTIVATLPGTSEKTSHGELAWSVGAGRSARQFATTWDHHHDDRNAVVFAAPPGAQEQLVGGAPDRYFRPPYVGGRGWVGTYLDLPDVDWDLVELHQTDAAATVAGERH